MTASACIPVLRPALPENSTSKNQLLPTHAPQSLIHQVYRSRPIPEYFVEFSANSPSNRAPTENPFLNPISTPADTSAKSVAGAAPVTTKIDPGSAWNPAVMFGADQLS